MRTQKPRQTSRSDPNATYVDLSNTVPHPRNTVVRTGLDAFPRVLNLQEFLPFPLVYTASVTAGFDFNPSSNRFVRDVSRHAPAFKDKPLRVTLPREAGVVNNVLFAMQSTSPWTSAGRKYCGNLHKPSAEANASRDNSIKRRGPTRKHEWTHTFHCAAHGDPRTSTTTPLTLATRRSAGSYKVQCNARFTIRQTLTGEHEFEWYWEHQNHNPYSIDDMRNMRMPARVISWLNDKVIKGLNWRSIQTLLECPDLFPVDTENLTVVPEAFKVSYEHVRYLIRKRAKKIRRLDSSVITSLERWVDRLQDRGWHVNSDIRASHKRCQIIFFSPWQREQLLKHGNEVICFDATHKVSRDIEEWPNTKLQLITLVIRHPVTGAGIPVVWYYTTDERTDSIAKLLTWLKDSFQVKPKVFMSDCALSYEKAVAQAYANTRDPPKHYWCLFHVSRAILAKAKYYYPPNPHGLHEDAMTVIYGHRWQDGWERLQRLYGTVAPLFIQYFRTQWVVHAAHSMKSERIVSCQGIHTNNYNETWHRLLKHVFMTRTKLGRADDTFQLLVDTVELHFRQTLITTSLGFRPQRSNKFQNVSKGLADTYSNDDLVALGILITHRDANTYTINSLTRPRDAIYTVAVTPPTNGRVGTVNNCTCAHFRKHTSACKHMYLIQRQTKYNISEIALIDVDDGESYFPPQLLAEPVELPVGAPLQARTPSPTPSPTHSQAMRSPTPPMHPYRSISGLAASPSNIGAPYPNTSAGLIPASIPPHLMPVNSVINTYYPPALPAALPASPIHTTSVVHHYYQGPPPPQPPPPAITTYPAPANHAHDAARHPPQDHRLNHSVVHNHYRPFLYPDDTTSDSYMSLFLYDPNYPHSTPPPGPSRIRPPSPATTPFLRSQAPPPSFPTLPSVSNLQVGTSHQSSNVPPNFLLDRSAAFDAQHDGLAPPPSSQIHTVRRSTTPYLCTPPSLSQSNGTALPPANFSPPKQVTHNNLDQQSHRHITPTITSDPVSRPFSPARQRLQTSPFHHEPSPDFVNLSQLSALLNQHSAGHYVPPVLPNPSHTRYSQAPAAVPEITVVGAHRPTPRRPSPLNPSTHQPLETSIHSTVPPLASTSVEANARHTSVPHTRRYSAIDNDGEDTRSTIDSGHVADISSTSRAHLDYERDCMKQHGSKIKGNVAKLVKYTNPANLKTLYERRPLSSVADLAKEIEDVTFKFQNLLSNDRPKKQPRFHS